jgi:hypothetical protein
MRSFVNSLVWAEGNTMSVRDVDAIDYIGVNILFRKVYIGIFDELDWQDETEHQKLLTRKIDRGLAFARSGQLLSSYPSVRGYDIVFQYVSTRPMTPVAAEYWKTREQVIRLAGFDVRTRGVDVRPSLGIKSEAIVEPEPSTPVEIAEPAPLTFNAAGIEVLDADPRSKLPDIADVSYLPQFPNRPRNRNNQPVLTRLSMRRAASS